MHKLTAITITEWMKQMRPNDVPNFRECVRRSWRISRWLLVIFPMTLIMTWAVSEYGLNSPQNPAQAQRLEEAISILYPAMLVVAAVLWLLIFFSTILTEWSAETPT